MGIYFHEFKFFIHCGDSIGRAGVAAFELHCGNQSCVGQLCLQLSADIDCAGTRQTRHSGVYVPVWGDWGESHLTRTTGDLLSLTLASREGRLSVEGVVSESKNNPSLKHYHHLTATCMQLFLLVSCRSLIKKDLFYQAELVKSDLDKVVHGGSDVEPRRDQSGDIRYSVT